MAEQIIDGKGRGYRAGVNSDNHLMVNSVSIPIQHHVAHFHQQGFTSVLSTTPTGPGSIFIYVSNTDNKRDLCLTKISVRVATNEYIEIYHSPVGTVGGINNLTVVNNFIGSGIVPDATLYYGTNLTGLTNGMLMKRFYIAANNLSNIFTFDTSLIIPNNRVLFMKAGNGAIQIDMNLSFNFHEVED